MASVCLDNQNFYTPQFPKAPSTQTRQSASASPRDRQTPRECGPSITAGSSQDAAIELSSDEDLDSSDEDLNPDDENLGPNDEGLSPSDEDPNHSDEDGHSLTSISTVDDLHGVGAGVAGCPGLSGSLSLELPGQLVDGTRTTSGTGLDLQDIVPSVKELVSHKSMPAQSSRRGSHTPQDSLPPASLLGPAIPSVSRAELGQPRRSVCHHGTSHTTVNSAHETSPPLPDVDAQCPLGLGRSLSSLDTNSMHRQLGTPPHGLNVTSREDAAEPTLALSDGQMSVRRGPDEEPDCGDDVVRPRRHKRRRLVSTSGPPRDEDSFESPPARAPVHGHDGNDAAHYSFRSCDTESRGRISTSPGDRHFGDDRVAVQQPRRVLRRRHGLLLTVHRYGIPPLHAGMFKRLG